MSTGLRLFSYGTLQLPQIQKILFDSEMTMEKAELKDWRLYADAEDYFFIRPEAGYSVSGRILLLDDQRLVLADAWEEVPKYLRSEVQVTLSAGGHCRAFVYWKKSEEGIPVLGQGQFAHIPLEAIIQAAWETKRQAAG